MKKIPINLRITNILGLFFAIYILFAGDVHSGEKKHLELAFKLVEQTNISKMYIELAEVFMEPYFERYEKKQIETKRVEEKILLQKKKITKKKIKNILIIDDQKDLCLLLSNTLKKKKFNSKVYFLVQQTISH